ncbi:alpha/beta fold hydrolase [Anaerococcus sp. WCA-380-WT-2B]|uniref:Alpha/beta fold hydrolase n=1 Tax=Anaerococcus porci TaxID=2652269 RepID=A0A6N7VF38_9FIRM|nr:alpha/beta fold hydrolase [Anaerococcus porci]MSS78050.1 alpha/beta fold hydrolase [Anaerococcus porci]
MKYLYRHIEKKDGIVLRGVVNTPDDFDSSKKYKTALFYHGFSGDRDGSHWFRILNSRYLTKKGYVCIRFDFSGTGESDGSFYDMTLTRELDEARIIYDFTKNLDFVDDSNIYFIGHSMGGVISILLADELKPKKMSLLAPASDMNNLELLKKTALNLYDYIDEKNRDKDLSDIEKVKKLVSIKDLDVGGLRIHKNFLFDIMDYDIYKKASLYKGEVQIIRGDLDDVVLDESNIKLNRCFKNSNYHVLENTDHSFTNYDQRMLLFEMMYEFFEK